MTSEEISRLTTKFLLKGNKIKKIKATEPYKQTEIEKTLLNKYTLYPKKYHVNTFKIKIY